MRLGVDLSSYFEEVANGAKWYVDGRETDPFEAFAFNGVKLVRLRVWNDPYDEKGRPYLGGTCNQDVLLAGALKAKSLGMKVMVDFHYSDFWADPAKQILPKAWKDLDIDQLTGVLQGFTEDTLRLLTSVGIDVHAVQVGNEITNGMCWPIGRLHGEAPNRTGYDELARLLKAGVEAVRRECPKAEIILHLENSGNRTVLDEWYGEITKRGVDFDVMGLSYYPYWHGTMENFFSNVRYLRDKYDKPVSIVETAYGFALEDYEKEPKSLQLVVNKENAPELTKTVPYPVSKEGQLAYVKDFIRMAKENEIHELYYWEPAYIPVVGAGWATEPGQEYVRAATKKETRNEWANQNLFDYEGHANPAFVEWKDK